MAAPYMARWGGLTALSLIFRAVQHVTRHWLSTVNPAAKDIATRSALPMASMYVSLLYVSLLAVVQCHLMGCSYSSSPTATAKSHPMAPCGATTGKMSWP